MRIDFDGSLIKDLEDIQKFMEKDKRGIKLSPSDAARWAIASKADEIREIIKSQ